MTIPVHLWTNTSTGLDVEGGELSRAAAGLREVDGSHAEGRTRRNSPRSEGSSNLWLDPRIVDESVSAAAAIFSSNCEIEAIILNRW